MNNKVLFALTGTEEDWPQDSSGSLLLLSNGDEIKQQNALIPENTDVFYYQAESQFSKRKNEQVPLNPKPMQQIIQEPNFSAVQNQLQAATLQYMYIKKQVQVMKQRVKELFAVCKQHQVKQRALIALKNSLATLIPTFQNACLQCQTTLEEKFDLISLGDYTDVKQAVADLRNVKIGDKSLIELLETSEESLLKDYAAVKSSKELLNIHLTGIKAFSASVQSRFNADATSLEAKQLLASKLDETASSWEDTIKKTDMLLNEYAHWYNQLVQEMTKNNNASAMAISSILGEVKARNFGTEVAQLDAFLCQELSNVYSKQYAFDQEYFGYISLFLKLRSRVTVFATQLNVFLEKANSCPESVIDKVKLAVQLPAGVKRSIEEVSRRRTFRKQYLQHVEKFNNTIKVLQENENSTRAGFALDLTQVMGRPHMPETIIPGLNDAVPELLVNAPAFDQNLPEKVEMQQETDWELVSNTNMNNIQDSMFKTKAFPDMPAANSMQNTLFFDTLSTNVNQVMQKVDQLFPQQNMQNSLNSSGSILDNAEHVVEDDDDLLKENPQQSQLVQSPASVAKQPLVAAPVDNQVTANLEVSLAAKVKECEELKQHNLTLQKHIYLLQQEVQDNVWTSVMSKYTQSLEVLSNLEVEYTKKQMVYKDNQQPLDRFCNMADMVRAKVTMSNIMLSSLDVAVPKEARELFAQLQKQLKDIEQVSTQIGKHACAMMEKQALLVPEPVTITATTPPLKAIVPATIKDGDMVKFEKQGHTNLWKAKINDLTCSYYLSPECLQALPPNTTECSGTVLMIVDHSNNPFKLNEKYKLVFAVFQ